MNTATQRPEPRIVIEAIGPLARLTLRETHVSDTRGTPTNEPLYWVSRLRGPHTCPASVCSVLYTRSELEELRGRIDAALLVG